MLELKLFPDDSEDISYNFLDFPIRAKCARLCHYPNMAAANHWHDDFEFTVILEGEMTYSVNGKKHLLRQGQAIFINSQQMHYGFSRDGLDCEFICLLITPSLVSNVNRIKEHYLTPIQDDSSHPYFIFEPTVTWQRQFIDQLTEIYQLCQEETTGFELHVMSLFYSICASLYSHVKQDQHHLESIPDLTLENLKLMIGYIQQSYPDKLTLNDIAASGNVCRSNCCKIFKQLLGKSPITYLTEYRLEKSIRLLKNSNASITEIALLCGFSNSSYFTETFRKVIGCTPSQYRKKQKNE